MSRPNDKCTGYLFYEGSLTVQLFEQVVRIYQYQIPTRCEGINRNYVTDVMGLLSHSKLPMDTTTKKTTLGTGLYMDLKETAHLDAQLYQHSGLSIPQVIHFPHEGYTTTKIIVFPIAKENI